MKKLFLITSIFALIIMVFEISAFSAVQAVISKRFAMSVTRGTEAATVDFSLLNNFLKKNKLHFVFKKTVKDEDKIAHQDRFTYAVHDHGVFNVLNADDQLVGYFIFKLHHESFNVTCSMRQSEFYICQHFSIVRSEFLDSSTPPSVKIAAVELK